MKIYVDDERKIPEGYLGYRSMLVFWKEWKNKLDKIEVLSLDHDMGENVPTGYDLLCEMEKFLFLEGGRLPQKIVVHSANPVGRKNMEQVIVSMYSRE